MYNSVHSQQQCWRLYSVFTRTIPNDFGSNVGVRWGMLLSQMNATEKLGRSLINTTRGLR
jgi:hypothetical protein